MGRAEQVRLIAYEQIREAEEMGTGALLSRLLSP
jgi:hypothetical protein